jgi:hypothetical protein
MAFPSVSKIAMKAWPWCCALFWQKLDVNEESARWMLRGVKKRYGAYRMSCLCSQNTENAELWCFVSIRRNESFNIHTTASMWLRTPKIRRLRGHVFFRCVENRSRLREMFFGAYLNPYCQNADVCAPMLFGILKIWRGNGKSSPATNREQRWCPPRYKY